MKYYYKLGKLPPESISFFKDCFYKVKANNLSYQRIQANSNVNDYFLKIFNNDILKLQLDRSGKNYVQNFFYSEPGYGFTIHRDGLKCKSALNISISSNSSDWVRWYDTEYINSISNVSVKNTSFITSRNTDIKNYEEVEFKEELHVESGDVYILDVEEFHSFKCNGPEPRIILQTKFDGFPDFNMLKKLLLEKNFINLIN